MFLSHKQEWNPQLSDVHWDALTIELYKKKSKKKTFFAPLDLVSDHVHISLNKDCWFKWTAEPGWQ